MTTLVATRPTGRASPPRGGFRPARRAGFTLVEMLLAMIVSGLILAFCIFQVVALAGVWMNSDDNDYFRQHADGVTLFLNNAFHNAEEGAAAAAPADAAVGSEPSAPEGGAGEALIPDAGPRQEPVRWERPPKYSEFDPPLLTFHLKEAPPILTNGGLRYPGLTCFLHFSRNEGLHVLWHSRLELVEEMEDLRSTLLSLWLTRLEYAYYDREENRWETTEEPKEDDNRRFLLPDALKLTFTHEDETITTAVYIPRRKPTVPLF